MKTVRPCILAPSTPNPTLCQTESPLLRPRKTESPDEKENSLRPGDRCHFHPESLRAPALRRNRNNAIILSALPDEARESTSRDPASHTSMPSPSTRGHLPQQPSGLHAPPSPSNSETAAASASDNKSGSHSILPHSSRSRR